MALAHRRSGRMPIAFILLLVLAVGLVAAMTAYRMAARERARARAAQLMAKAAQRRAAQANGAQRMAEERMRNVLDETSREVASELEDQPQAQAAIRLTIGRSHISLGEFDKAEAALLAAQVFCEQEPAAPICQAILEQLVELYTRWAVLAPAADHAAMAQRWRGKLEAAKAKPAE